MNATVIDTPEGIKFAQLCALKGALKLEMLGMKRRGRSAYAVLKSMGYKGSRQTVLAAVEAEVKRQLGE